MACRGIHLQASSKRQEACRVLGKKQKAQLIVSKYDIDSPLFQTSYDNKEKVPLQKQLYQTEEFLILPTNRIYHQKETSKQYSHLQGNSKGRDPRKSLNNISKPEIEVTTERMGRPQSSQRNKHNQELFTIRFESTDFQNRPGSSKSSRLFRSKGPFGNDILHTQSDESQSLVYVGCSRTGTSCIRSKNVSKGRAGTSTNNRKMVIEKIPGKIDPDFFRLFAQ